MPIADGCTASLAVGDFDEDGKPDVGLLDAYGTKLTLGFGVGDGTFTGAVSIPVGQEPSLLPSSVGAAAGSTCPTNNSLNQPGLALSSGGIGGFVAGHYTGGAHWDLWAGRSVFVTNGRNAPTQEFVRFNNEGTVRGAYSAANTDFNGDGTTDFVYGFSGPRDLAGMYQTTTKITLINPPGYHSW
jgi:hypothetical protein